MVNHNLFQREGRHHTMPRLESETLEKTQGQATAAFHKVGNKVGAERKAWGCALAVTGWVLGGRCGRVREGQLTFGTGGTAQGRFPTCTILT